MTFRYDVLNLAVLDDAREVFAKPSTQWTDTECKKAALIIGAMQIVASQKTVYCPKHVRVMERPIPKDECDQCAEVTSDERTKDG